MHSACLFHCIVSFVDSFTTDLKDIGTDQESAERSSGIPLKLTIFNLVFEPFEAVFYRTFRKTGFAGQNKAKTHKIFQIELNGL